MYFRFYDYLDIDSDAAEFPFIESVIILSTKAFYKDFNNEASYQWVLSKGFAELPNLIFEVHDNCVAIEHEEGHGTHVYYQTNVLTYLKSYIEEESPEIRTKLLSYIVHKN